MRIEMTKNTIINLFARMAPAAILLFAPALASADTIRLVPSSTTVTVGDVFNVDLIAASLQLGGYDVTFSYDPLLAWINLDQVTFDSHLGGADNSFPFWFAGLDTLELTEVSFLTSAPDLAALQSDPSYPLAHIGMKALLPGTLTLDFVSSPFTGGTDYSGLPIDGVTYEGASVTILAAEPPPPTSPVPEPDSVVLLLTGIGLLALARLVQRAAGAA
jgi:hypothetical protein